MTTTTLTHGRHVSLMLSLGLLGGALLVVCAMFLTPGRYVLLPYFGLLLATAIVIKAARIPTFKERFFVAFGAFMSASLSLYLAIGVMAGTLKVIGLLGHAWRVGAIVLIGLALNAAIARVSDPS